MDHTKRKPGRAAKARAERRQKVKKKVIEISHSSLSAISTEFENNIRKFVSSWN